jgi:hypothetical protein
VGYFDLPDTKNFELNKYGFRLIFKQMLIFSTNFRDAEGFDAHLLYMCTNLMLVKPMATRILFSTIKPI